MKEDIAKMWAEILGLRHEARLNAATGLWFVHYTPPPYAINELALTFEDSRQCFDMAFEERYRNKQPQDPFS